MAHPIVNDLVRFAGSVEAAVGKKRGRKPVFNSNMFYPYVPERELQGLTRKEFLRFITEALSVATIGTSFGDDISELSDLEPQLPDDFKKELSRISRNIEGKALKNFAEQSEMTIGKPYYPPEVKDDILKNWQDNFEMLCKSAETDAKKDISQIVIQAKNEGWNKNQLEKAVMQKLPDKYKYRAENIARTETAKLNTQVNLETYKGIGIEYYTWMTTMDGRERESHAEMNGLICSVNDPDVYFDENPQDPMHPIQKSRTGAMYHGHPGTDYQCRCSMVAWDPMIYGKYEVKENGIPPEDKPMTTREVLEETAKNAKAELEKEKVRREQAENTAKLAQKKTKETLSRLNLMTAANNRHIERSAEVSGEIATRYNERKERTMKFDELITDAKSRNVNFNEVAENEKVLSQDQIIAKISGDDKTRGSCSSLALAYIANKYGMDVLDFRGGKSCDVFAERVNIKKFVQSGGIIASGKKELDVAKDVLGNVKKGKEYFFSCGRHAAIVKRTETGVEYLELQSGKSSENVFTALDDEALKKRFMTRVRPSNNQREVFLIEAGKLKDSVRFKEMMGYINTPAGKQKKR